MGTGADKVGLAFKSEQLNRGAANLKKAQEKINKDLDNLQSALDAIEA